MIEKAITTLLLLLAGALLTRTSPGERIVRLLTKTLTLGIVPVLLFLDCQEVDISSIFCIILTISLIHMISIVILSEIIFRKVNMSSIRKTAGILSAILPNVIYLPYSIYAVFNVDTSYLMPYVLAANIMLPFIIMRAQLMLQRESKFLTMLKELTPSIVILSSVLLGLAVSFCSNVIRESALADTVRFILGKLMLLAFVVLGFDIARIRNIPRDVFYPVLVRNLISPVLMLIILATLMLIHVEIYPDYVKGLIIESLTPTAVAAVLFSRIIGADSTYAAAAVSVTTLIALPQITLLVWIWY